MSSVIFDQMNVSHFSVFAEFKNLPQFFFFFFQLITWILKASESNANHNQQIKTAATKEYRWQTFIQL